VAVVGVAGGGPGLAARPCLVGRAGRQPGVEPVGETSTEPARVTAADTSIGLLTPREREVAVLVTRGLTNRQIAAALVIAERTADVHVSNFLNKLTLTSRAQLAAWVARRGLLEERDGEPLDPD
jgi:non-specific serine/threonine protein kinase